MKLSTAVKILKNMELAVIKARSIAMENMGIDDPNDADKDAVLTSLQPWLFGENGILMRLNGVNQRAAKGELDVPTFRNFVTLAEREPTIGICYVPRTPPLPDMQNLYGMSMTWTPEDELGDSAMVEVAADELSEFLRERADEYQGDEDVLDDDEFPTDAYDRFKNGEQPDNTIDWDEDEDEPQEPEFVDAREVTNEQYEQMSPFQKAIVRTVRAAEASDKAETEKVEKPMTQFGYEKIHDFPHDVILAPVMVFPRDVHPLAFSIAHAELKDENGDEILTAVGWLDTSIMVYTKKAAYLVHIGDLLNEILLHEGSDIDIYKVKTSQKS